MRRIKNYNCGLFFINLQIKIKCKGFTFTTLEKITTLSELQDCIMDRWDFLWTGFGENMLCIVPLFLIHIVCEQITLIKKWLRFPYLSKLKLKASSTSKFTISLSICTWSIKVNRKTRKHGCATTPNIFYHCIISVFIKMELLYIKIVQIKNLCSDASNISKPQGGRDLV